MNKFDIKDGEYTSTIYGLIKEQRFNEAIAILTYIYDTNTSSRAALSLLAYCHYYMQERNCIEMFYLNSTLNFGIPPGFVFQLEIYYKKVDRLLNGLTAQQKGTTD